MSRPEAFAFVAGGTVQAGGGVYLERDAPTASCSSTAARATSPTS